MIKWIFKNWHRYVLWALLSVIVWAWIFTLLFSAKAAEKVSLYAELPGINGNGLAAALEEDLPEGIRRIDPGSFDVGLFNEESVLAGDLYLVPEPEVELFASSFAPIDRSAFPGETFLEIDGTAYGILASDPETGYGAASEYVVYYQNVRCYLCFNKDSIHLGTWNGSADDAAITVARQFLDLK